MKFCDDTRHELIMMEDLVIDCPLCEAMERVVELEQEIESLKEHLSE